MKYHYVPQSGQQAPGGVMGAQKELVERLGHWTSAHSVSNTDPAATYGKIISWLLKFLRW